MKTLFAFAIALLPLAALADSSACYSIGDPDARLYCLATTKQEPSTCYSIVKPDMRALCLAKASQ